MQELRKRRLPHIDVNGNVLRVYAGITLLCCSVSMSVLQFGLLHVQSLSGSQLRELLAGDPDKMILASWAVVLQLLGGLSIPVFAFLLTQRFLKPDQFKRELLWLLALAILSEVPYDMAMSGEPFDLTRQNMVFSLVVGYIMLYGLRMFAASRGAQLLIVLAAVLWGSLLRSGFSLGLILLTAAFYLLRGDPKRQTLWTSLIGLLYVTAPISHFVLKRYNGDDSPTWPRDLFACLYPAHLLLLAVIASRL